MSQVLNKNTPKQKKKINSQTLKAKKIIQSLPQTPATTSVEPQGFIGKHLNKVVQQTKAVAIQDAITSLPAIKYSKDAPGHKGVLARIQEREIKEKLAKEEKEKQELMAEALNDPEFKSQM